MNFGSTKSDDKIKCISQDVVNSYQTFLNKFAVLLIYLPSYLGQETVKWLLRSSSQAATCYY